MVHNPLVFQAPYPVLLPLVPLMNAVVWFPFFYNRAVFILVIDRWNTSIRSNCNTLCFWTADFGHAHRDSKITLPAWASLRAMPTAHYIRPSASRRYTNFIVMEDSWLGTDLYIPDEVVPGGKRTFTARKGSLL